MRKKKSTGEKSTGEKSTGETVSQTPVRVQEETSPSPLLSSSSPDPLFSARSRLRTAAPRAAEILTGTVDGTIEPTREQLSAAQDILDRNGIRKDTPSLGISPSLIAGSLAATAAFSALCRHFGLEISLPSIEEEEGEEEAEMNGPLLLPAKRVGPAILEKRKKKHVSSPSSSSSSFSIPPEFLGNLS